MLTPGQVRDRVVAEITGYLRGEGHELDTLPGDSGLVETGVDSLGMAVIIARLEDGLGYDPFLTVEGADFPGTVDELVDVYVRGRPQAGTSRV